MSRAQSKHERDQAMDFQGFLNDFQDWELSLKDKDKKLKPQASEKGQSIGLLHKERQSAGKSTRASHHQHAMSYDTLSRVSSSYMTEDTSVDAVSEKELGNEYFKQKKFNEAIDCYSRSIAFLPTAVAYANRAMAYLKIKRFQEAEDDCTEALNLDDRYVKAYSRRATARKELGKLKESMDDADFALRLEPDNVEIKKQFAEIKSLLEKAILRKASGAARNPVRGVKEVENKHESNGHARVILPISSSSKKSGVDAIPDQAEVSVKKAVKSGDMGSRNNIDEWKTEGRELNGSQRLDISSTHLRNNETRKQEMGPSVQELASRAASRAMMEGAKNISPPNSAYQFEVSWKGYCGDQSLQARLLKVTPPHLLPQIFKNALSAPILIDIIKCIANFFMEDTELAVKYLENLIKVPRFDMIIMCLPSADKAELIRAWDEVFLSKATPIKYAELLNELHPRKHWGCARYAPKSFCTLGCL
ncbi:hypothetical protein Nepgr_001621 [Nepenthes gracilis]|uniref:RNA-polymerase II-associated protein 3-like C-terminal domain-containing protein n=1 Tax=Nepenthes gracilis TaxID=150966 RepID=A0AAD3P8S8_NEPGR|nr:hypothetical protein Nepgr_001621 [Nepenthes gracilis]